MILPFESHVSRSASPSITGRLLQRWSAPLAALLLGVSLLPMPAQAAAGVPLRLIGFNDFHGHLEAAELNLTLADPAAPGKLMQVPVGGAAALAGMVARLRDSAAHSLVLSSGDLVGAAPLVSTLFRHESTIDVMNQIGLEVNAAGNHEFDAGLAELQRLFQGGCTEPATQAAISSCVMGPWRGARFPLLAANVHDRQGKPVFAPWVIKRYQGIPVGIVGAVTRTTPSIVVPSGVAGLRFGDEVDAINRAVRQLQRRGVRAIVVTMHEGGEVGPAGQRADWNDTRCSGAEGSAFDIVRRLSPEVDVVFTAHTHQGYRCEVGGRVVIQGTAQGRGLSVVDVVLDRRSRDIDRRQTRSINLPVLNERTDAAQRERLAGATPHPYAALLRVSAPDTAVAARVAQYAAVVAPKAAQPVGRIGGAFTRASAPGGRSDSAAGRLIADAQLAATRASGAQIAFMNPGGIRSDLVCAAPPCSVDFGTAFTAQPFGNSLVVMSLTGAQLHQLLEGQQREGRAEPSFMSPSRGFGYRWLAAAPPGQRVQDMRLDGQPIVPTQTYRVTVNSFMAEGGDGHVVLREGRERVGGPQDLDALVAYLGAEPPRAPDPRPRVAWVAP
jgi:5'-nucleotidase